MRIDPGVYKKVVGGKIFIDEYFHQPIDLGAISRKACISRFHFHRLFTRIYRQTPHRYLTQKRLVLAQQLLTDDKLSISEICCSVGFESIGSFSLLFKKEIGYSPSYFRNMAWLKKHQARTQPKKFIPHCFIMGYGPAVDSAFEPLPSAETISSNK